MTKAEHGGVGGDVGGGEGCGVEHCEGSVCHGSCGEGEREERGGGEEINLRRMLKVKEMVDNQKGDAKVNDLHTLKGRCILTCRFSTKLKPPILAR